MMEILLRQPYSFWQRGKRPNQEDARFPNCDTPQGCKPAFVVCDGVGGQDKGEVASCTVADAIGRYIENVDLTVPFTSSDFSKVLEYVYSCLYKKMRNDTREMATTMAFVCVNSAGVFCAHMGDSRIYQVRPGVGIMYQSEDHSLVNALVHSGNLTPEEAINHPKSNVITRCISYVEKGMDKPSATTIQLKDVEAGDYFFLCSDGVLHCIDDDELFSILSSDKTDKEKIHIIAEQSKDSSDNNTAYLIGVEHVITDNDNAIANDADTTEKIEVTGAVTVPLDNSNNLSDEVYANVESTGIKISNFFKGLFKYMKLFSALCTLLIMAFILLTQNVALADRIKIERIRVAQSDLSARTLKVKDLNGNNCALIKMFIVIPDVRFQGNIVKVEENNPGEYWVYMTAGSKELRINAPNNVPIDVNFLNTNVGAPLCSSMVYEIYFSIEELSPKMSLSSFNNAIAHRNTLMKDGKYSEAIESLTILKDSLKDIGVSQYVASVDSRINECKRRQALEKTGYKKYGVLSEGMIMIRKDYISENGNDVGLIGFMDSVGNIVVEPKYNRGLDYNKGVAWVSKDGHWGSLDKKGAVNIPLEYKVIKPIMNNHKVNWMEVSVDSIHYGIVDYATGRQVLPMRYEDISRNESPDDNPLVALYDPSQKKTNFYNKKDFSPEFSIGNRQKVEWYLDYGLFLTSIKKGMKKNIYGQKYEEKVYGIVDHQGRQVLECENYIGTVKDLEKFWSETNDFVKVKCPPSKNWNDWQIPAWRIYSLKDREFIEDAEYRNLYTEVIGKWKDWIVVGRWHDYHRYTYYGMINLKDGTKLFDPYSNIECRPYNREPEAVNERENLILECTGRKWYLFNNDGDLIELPKNDADFQYRFFKQGYAILKTDGKYGFVDSNGKIVVNPRYDEAFYDYESDSWKLRNGDETISLDNIITLSD